MASIISLLSSGDIDGLATFCEESELLVCIDTLIIYSVIIYIVLGAKRGDDCRSIRHSISCIPAAKRAVSQLWTSCYAITLLSPDYSDHAKLLWKRVPGAVKSSNPEIPALWEVGKRLWRREFQEVYPIISGQQWPPNIQPLLHQLQGT